MTTGLAGYALGTLLLVLGSDSLLKGAAGLALNLRMHPARVGIVVLGFGAGLAAFAVDLAAVLGGNPGLAVGNVVGGNVALVGGVLGVAALVRPLDVRFALAHWLLPLLIGAGVVLLVVGFDLELGRTDAIVLLATFVFAFGLIWWRAARESPAVQQAFAEAAETRREPGRVFLRLVVGGVALSGGAWLAARAATGLAPEWGLTAATAGLSLAAFASALPVLAIAIPAAVRGHGDLALAAALGASLVNLTLGLGVGALFGPMQPAALGINATAMLVFALALYPMLRSDACLTSSEGATLLAAWLLYLAWQLFLASPV